MIPRIRSLLLRLVLALAALAPALSLAAGPKAYVGNFKDNTVSVIDTASGRVLSTIPVASGPHGMSVSSDGRTVYVTGDESSGMSVIDTGSDKVVKTVEVGKTPHGIALTPDGKTLLVAVNGEDRVAFVDTATQRVIGSVSASKPHTIAVRPDGKLAYVALQEPGKFGLAVIDLAARSVVRTIALQRTPRDLEFAHDGRALYFTLAGVPAVQVLDPTTNVVVAEIPTGPSPHYANFFRNTSLGIVVVQGPGELLLFDPATNKPVRSIAVGKQPHWVTASSDGKQAYVPNEGSNDFSIVELASGKVTTVPVGNAPRKVVVQPTMSGGAGAKVSISNFAFVDATVTISPGQRVTWSNDDAAPHAVAFKDGSAGARSLSPGETFSRVFDKAGTYEYFCAFHPYMTGKVVVQG